LNSEAHSLLLRRKTVRRRKFQAIVKIAIFNWYNSIIVANFFGKLVGNYRNPIYLKSGRLSIPARINSLVFKSDMAVSLEAA